MEKIRAALTFVGRPFPDKMMDEQRSFAASNRQLEQDEPWQQFLQANKLRGQRASLVVFGPEDFMYWYGLVTAKQDLDLAAGLLKFQLPQARVAEEEQTGKNLSYFDQPLNLTLPLFLQKVAAAGSKVYENLGDSDTPYVLQSLDLATKKLTQTLYLAVSH